MKPTASRGQDYAIRPGREKPSCRTAARGRARRSWLNCAPLYRDPTRLLIAYLAPLAMFLIHTALTSTAAASNHTVPQILAFEVVREIPHDPSAFTQGLLWHGGRLFESTGLRGRSSIRELEAATGAILRRRQIDRTLFGEGLARVGRRLVQLTWHKRVALEYRLEDLTPTGRQFHYSGEGWGLCYDGEVLWMSNGTSTLRQRNPKDFSTLAAVSVRLSGRPVARLNELECVGDAIYANVWQSDFIVRIDKRTGQVTGVLNASGLFPERGPQHDVLNGIAFNPASNTFYLTGKLWPRIFEVRIQPAENLK